MAESPRLITRKMLITLKELSGHERELSRWVRQLSRLGSLRNLSNTIIQEALAMAITIDKTKDGLYQLGKEEGKEEVAISLLKEGFAPEVVSRISKLPLDKVKALLPRLTD